MKKILALAVLFASTLSIADGLVFGTHQYGGSGCPPDSIPGIASPNGNSYSLLPGRFSLLANHLTGPVRIYCQIKIPFLTRNQTLIQVDYRGFHALPDNALSDQQVSYSLENTEPVSHFDSTYDSRIDGYTHSHQLNVTCKHPGILKILVSSLLFSTARNENATSELNTIDLAETKTASPDVILQLACSGVTATASAFSALAIAMMAAFFSL